MSCFVTQSIQNGFVYMKRGKPQTTLNRLEWSSDLILKTVTIAWLILTVEFYIWGLKVEKCMYTHLSLLIILQQMWRKPHWIALYNHSGIAAP